MNFHNIYFGQDCVYRGKDIDVYMNMNNMEAIMKAAQGWKRFTTNHPKFPMFLQAVRNTGIQEGSVIEVSITDPSGKVMDTNIKVTADDIELFQSLKEIKPY